MKYCEYAPWLQIQGVDLLARGHSTVVDHSTHNPKIKGLNPATGSGDILESEKVHQRNTPISIEQHTMQENNCLKLPHTFN
jgi:hypothetical protein